MKRSSNSWWFPVLLASGVVCYGMPAGAQNQDAEAIRRASAERDALYQRQLTEIANRTPFNSAEYNRTYTEWLDGKARAASLAGNLDRIAADMKSREARDKANQPPGAGSKILDMALGVLGEALKGAIKNWMDNPNAENLRRIEELEAERDRLETVANNPNPGTEPGAGTGRPVYDDNGNVIGFDRDGDGRVDVTDTNGDGVGDTSVNANDAYADPYEYLNTPTTATTPEATTADDDDATDGGNSSGGGASAGGSFGASPSGGGAGDEGGAEEGEGDEEELAKDDKDEEGTPTGKEDSDGDLATSERDKDGDGKDDKTGEQLEMISGRILVMPKADPALMGPGGAVGNRAPTGPVEDDWNDMEDNGDKEDEWGEDWGDDWGSEPSTNATEPTGPEGTPPAPGAPVAAGTRMGTASETTQLVDQLIRVETVIAEWRKKAKEEAEGKNDPYGFQDAKGYQSSESTTGDSLDPLAQLRGPDGKLDLTRCEIWVIERDTWQEGKEPKRYQVTVSEDAIDQFDPINGGYVVVRGIVGTVPVETRVLEEIRGDVKKLEIVQVVLSQEEPPEGGVAGSGDTLPPLDEEEGTPPNTPAVPPAPRPSDDGW